MLVSAWYEDGKLVLPEEITLKHRKVKVTIDLPEEEIEVAGDYRSPFAGTDPMDEAGISDPALLKLVCELRNLRTWKGPWGGEKTDQELFAAGLDMKYGKEE